MYVNSCLPIVGCALCSMQVTLLEESTQNMSQSMEELCATSPLGHVIGGPLNLSSGLDLKLAAGDGLAVSARSISFL